MGRRICRAGLASSLGWWVWHPACQGSASRRAPVSLRGWCQGSGGSGGGGLLPLDGSDPRLGCEALRRLEAVTACAGSPVSGVTTPVLGGHWRLE